MSSEEVFTIIHNYRKKKIVKHRNRRQVPPIAVETRHMSHLKARIGEGISLPPIDSPASPSDSHDYSMHNLIEEELNQESQPKNESPDSTPFGEPMIDLAGIDPFLNFSDN